jgi:hypothetical protein
MAHGVPHQNLKLLIKNATQIATAIPMPKQKQKQKGGNVTLSRGLGQI